jgi:ankyrin repeat protein
MLAKYFNKTIKFVVLYGFIVFFNPANASPVEGFFVAVVRDDPVNLRRAMDQGADLNGLSQHQETALTMALRLGSQRVIRALMADRRLDVNQANGAGETPLMLAALKGQQEWVRRLLLRGAYVNHPGWTPLHYAASHASEAALPMVEALLAHHAYIDAESPNGTTPLMMAAQYGIEAVVVSLLEAGADASLRNQQGLSALDFAQRADRPDIVLRLERAYP